MRELPLGNSSLTVKGKCASCPYGKAAQQSEKGGGRALTADAEEKMGRAIKQVAEESPHPARDDHLRSDHKGEEGGDHGGGAEPKSFGAKA